MGLRRFNAGSEHASRGAKQRDPPLRLFADSWRHGDKVSRIGLMTVHPS